jgi:hypothetical protein
MTRMELVKCANPKCWRFLPREVGSARDTCDDACAIQHTPPRRTPITLGVEPATTFTYDEIARADTPEGER